MARLNDPPVPTESIDSLKRRFIRQNREIARVNSTQSLRIRNLEAEISRLLAENISLREQVINSAQEAERLRSSRRLAEEVGRLKEKLESKLSEVNALVTELSSLPERAARRSSIRRRSGIAEPVRSPDQKEWRNRQTIGGVLAGERELQEGRLPPIHEDKYYPRRTLEDHEIRRLVEDDVQASESPDLGPPPVAHFDVPDPIKFEPQPVIAEDHALSTEEEQVMVNNTNLETRRKRRPSVLLENLSVLEKNSTNAQASSDENDNLLKPGSKRKLSVRDDDDNTDNRLKDPDDFTFQRKSVTSSTPLPRNKGSRFVRPVSKLVVQPPREDPLVPSQEKDVVERRVLAPKSTNSPTKSRSVNINDKIAALKEDVANQAMSRTTRQDRRRNIAPVKTVQSSNNDDAVERPEPTAQVTDLPPKTPAGLDLLSPTSTEPSVRSNAQSTEIAITTSVEDVLGDAVRGSRRARAAVSYAEPNLRDKMRRPGKQLVTAVEGIDHFKNREPSATAESVDRIADEDVIKTEDPPNDSAWKGLPQAKDEAPSPLREKATRLSDESRHVRGKGLDEAASGLLDPPTIESAISKLSIYDGPTSSPNDNSKGNSDSSSVEQPENTNSSMKNPTLHSRRHSVNLASSGASRFSHERKANRERERQPRPSSTTGHSRQGSASGAGRRVEVARPGSSGSGSATGELKRSASATREALQPIAAAGTPATELKRSTSAAALNSNEAIGGEVGRSERVALRRRSMMI